MFPPAPMRILRGMRAIVVHGGAGQWSPAGLDLAPSGVAAAVNGGYQVLAQGGSALRAVVAAVAILEDHTAFNAGTGSCLNLAGDIEMDASVMEGHTLAAGGVGGLRQVRNPVHVAQLVLRDTGHVLLVGEGALRFARTAGFPPYDPRTPHRREAYDRRMSQGPHPPGATWTGDHGRLGDRGEGGDTVGAVALDEHGHFAAATSTGGVSLKLPGRVGDSAIPGAGNYACRHAAASATGQGELMMRMLTAKLYCDQIGGGASAQQAIDAVLAQMLATFGPAGAHVGLIGLDADGGIGIGHATPAMPHGWYTQGMDAPKVRMLTP